MYTNSLINETLTSEILIFFLSLRTRVPIAEIVFLKFLITSHEISFARDRVSIRAIARRYSVHIDNYIIAN